MPDFGHMWPMQKKFLFFSTTMLPKSTTDKLAEAKAKKEQLEHKLEEAQCEADWEEEAEQQVEAAHEQWKCNEEAATEEKWEVEVAKVLATWVMG